ncbi:MAG TPA: YqzL family protein [Clostridiales bacterium]|nr:YqzL family protein [Clostridiales bacterium]
MLITPELLWKLFMLTGNINAYLAYKEMLSHC